MRKLCLLGGVSLILAGCANVSDLAPEDFMADRQPVNPTTESGGNAYSSVLAGYNRRTVSEPKPWGKSKSDEGESQ